MIAKNLTDWTLAEAMQYCKEQGCDNCPFKNQIDYCLFDYSEPASWRLPYTPPEVKNQSDSKGNDSEKPDNTKLPLTSQEKKQPTVKPQLAQLLGVDVGERFSIQGAEKNVIFQVTEDGLYVTEPQDYPGSNDLLISAVTDPNKIVHLPVLTESERMVCRTLGAKWISRDSSSEATWVELWREMPGVKDERDKGRAYYPRTGTVVLALVDGNSFPSIRPGDCVEVDE